MSTDYRERTERGHRYYGAFLTDGLGLPTQAKDVATDIHVAKATALAFNPYIKYQTRGAFMGGSVFDKKVDNKGVEIYSHPSTWRESVGRAVRAGGGIPLHGLDFVMHDIDPAGGAGEAMLAILASSVHIINAQTRIGIATSQEGQLALAAGNNVGVLLRPRDYDRARKFLEKRGDFPSPLQAYFPLLDVQVGDLIRGTRDLPEWLHRQFRKIQPRNFIGRTISMTDMAKILHFTQAYSHIPGINIPQLKELTEKL